MREYEKTIDDCTQAIELNPDHAHAYYNRGVARKQRGDKQGAISDFEQAARLYWQQENTEGHQDSFYQLEQLQQSLN